MQVYLETERLVLRQFTQADVENLYELDADPQVMRYLSGGPGTPREMIAGEILPRFMGYYARGDGRGVWAAIEKASGEFLGWLSLRPSDDDPGEVDLGYRLRRAAWGKGYATEGARALIRKAFTELGVERVVASTYQDNAASRRVMERCGLTFVQSYHPTPDDITAVATFDSAAAGEVWEGDDVVYAVTKAEWERQQTAAHQRSLDTSR